MRLGIQVRFIKEHKQYLESQQIILEPAFELLRDAVKKSKKWLEDEHASESYSDISHQLEIATLALLNASSEILEQNSKETGSDEPSSYLNKTDSTSTTTKNQVCVDTGSTHHAQARSMDGKDHHFKSDLDAAKSLIRTMKKELQTHEKKLNELEKHTEVCDQKYEENCKVLKSKFDKISKKNKTLENRVKQQDKRIGEFNESMEEIKSCYSYGIEEVNQEVIETKNVACDLRKYIDALSRSMYGKKLSIDDLTSTEYIVKNQGIISTETYQTLRSDLEKSCNEMFENFNAKFGAVCQLMSTRIHPLESLLGIFHKNITARKKLKTQVQDISRKLVYIESRACSSYACHVQLDDTPLISGFILSTFSSVREYNGHHFNRRTGKFVSPHDGLYLVCLTLHEWEDKWIELNVNVGGKCIESFSVESAEVKSSGFVVVDMKKGQELFLQVDRADHLARLSLYSSLTLISL